MGGRYFNISLIKENSYEKDDVFNANFMLLLSSNAIKAFDWNEFTAPPCNPDPNNPWQGPKTMRICASEISELLDCDPECCFTIVYYDRWTGTTNNEYELNVVGIFKDDGLACAECDETNLNILSAAYTKIMYELSRVYPDFKNRVMNNGIPPDQGWDAAVYVYSTAKCKLPGGEECNIGNRCCKHFSSIHFSRVPGEENYVAGFSCSWIPILNIPCSPPENCTPHCFEFATGVNPDTCFIEPCADGYWFQEEESFSIRACPNCTINLTFQYRNNLNCVPPLYEYQIISWTQSEECNYCFGGPNEIYDGIVEWLLANGPINEELLNGNCIDRIRFINAQCWNISNWPEPNTWTECPGNFACCTRSYRICRDVNGVLLDPILLDYSGYLLRCEEPCSAICGDFPTITLPNKDLNTSINLKSDYNSPSFKLTYNLNNGIYRFELDSEINGNVDLDIYNIAGDKFFNIQAAKESNPLIIGFDENELTVGVYIAVLRLNGLKIISIPLFVTK